MIIPFPTEWENTSHVPTHQPDMGIQDMGLQRIQTATLVGLGPTSPLSSLAQICLKRPGGTQRTHETHKTQVEVLTTKVAFESPLGPLHPLHMYYYIPYAKHGAGISTHHDWVSFFAEMLVSEVPSQRFILQKMG